MHLLKFITLVAPMKEWGRKRNNIKWYNFSMKNIYFQNSAHHNNLMLFSTDEQQFSEIIGQFVQCICICLCLMNRFLIKLRQINYNLFWSWHHIRTFHILAVIKWMLPTTLYTWRLQLYIVLIYHSKMKCYNRFDIQPDSNTYHWLVNLTNNVDIEIYNNSKRERKKTTNSSISAVTSAFCISWEFVLRFFDIFNFLSLS